MSMPGRGKDPSGRLEMQKTEAENMGENFYRALNEFQAKYTTREEREAALRTMSAEKILQLARACATLEGACFYARFAQAAADRNG